MANAVQEYKMSLDDLTFNSKPHINALTMLAEEYLPHADHIVRLIEAQLNKAVPNAKLPIMYLMDSIVKNVGGNYTPLFAKNIVSSFYSTFDAGDEKTKISLHKLRSTWDAYFPLKKLFELDSTIHSVDPNWPVKPLPASLQEPTSIHVNPKFLKKTDSSSSTENLVTSNMATSVRTSSSSSLKDSVDLQQELINKKKQLLDLQQQKLLLELEQTNQLLLMKEQKNKMMKKQGESSARDPRVKPAAPSAAGLKVTVLNGQKTSQQSAGRDPRSQAVHAKSKQSCNTTPVQKKDPPPSSKSQDSAKQANATQKKTLSESPKQTKSGPRRSNEGEKVTKNKKSPTGASKNLKNCAKAASTKKVDSVKSEPVKKLKVAKKVESKTVKKATSKPDLKLNQPKSNQKEAASDSGKPKTSEKVKKRDRAPRRSPPHSLAPPVKQARRSTSVERRPLHDHMDKPTDNDHRMRTEKTRHGILREEERKRGRESPRSHDGSISPRFSPEPDEMSPKKDWKPPIKRNRPSPPLHSRRPQPEINPASVRHPFPRRRPSVDPNLRIPQQLTLSHQAEILKQAEIQLQTGQLTHSQHQELLKQLHQLFELQRLRNMQAMDEPLEMDEAQRRKEFFERRNIPERDRMPMTMQNDNSHVPAFHPPPSPPPMDDPGNSENFAPSNYQRRMPRGPRFERPPRRPPGHGDPRHPRGSHPGNLRNPRPQHHLNVTERGPDPRQPSSYVVVEDMMHDQYRSPEFRARDDRFHRGNQRKQHPANTHHKMAAQKDPRSRGQKDASFRKNKENSEQNNDAPHSLGENKVPLRVYAHDAEDGGYSHGQEKEHIGKETKHHPCQTKEEEIERRHQESHKLKSGDGKEKLETGAGESDPEDEGPRLEEPEDYIIASIPPEAEFYHKHSMTLKRRSKEEGKAYRDHKRSILLSTYKKNTEDAETAVNSSDPASNKPSVSSPEHVKKEKVDEDANKSPSLPLKKRRKYLVSSSDFSNSDVKTESSDGGVTETETETMSSVIVKDEVGEEEVADSTRTDADEMETEVNMNIPVDSEVDKQEKDEIIEEKEEEAVAESNASELAESTDANTEVDNDVADKNLEQAMNTNEDVPNSDPDAYQAEDAQKDEKNDEHMPPREEGGDDEYSKIEEERLQSLMREEEERMQWEEELAEQLKMEMRNGNRQMDGPPPRDWGRPRGSARWERENIQRGRGLARGRGRGFRMNEERWRNEMRDVNENFPPRGPRDEGPPFPGRHPDRMPPHMDRMPPHPDRMHHNRPMHHHEHHPEPRNWNGPPEDEFRHPHGPPRHGFDRQWVENDRGPHPQRHDMPPMMRHGAEGHPDDHRFGPRYHPYHPAERIPMNRERDLGPHHFPPEHGRRPNEHSPPREFTPPRLPAENPVPEMNQLNVNKLLTDLLRIGIIPGNKASQSEPQKTETGSPRRTDSPVPSSLASILSSVASKPVEGAKTIQTTAGALPTNVQSSPQERVPTPVFYDEDLMNLDPDLSIPEITLKDLDKLKIRCDPLIKRLYTGIQCSACGMRFTACQTDMYAEHLDWHYRLNRKDKDGIKDTHRQIYPTAGDWIMYEEIEDPTQRSKNQLFEETSQENQVDVIPDTRNEEDLVVPVRSCPDEDKCTVCKEPFKTVYNDEDDEWQFVNCVAVDGKNFHPNCYVDHTEQPGLEPLPTPVRVPLYNPIEQSLKGIPGLDILKEENDQVGEENKIKNEVEDLPKDKAAASDNHEEPMTQDNAPEPWPVSAHEMDQVEGPALQDENAVHSKDEASLALENVSSWPTAENDGSENGTEPTQDNEKDVSCEAEEEEMAAPVQSESVDTIQEEEESPQAENKELSAIKTEIVEEPLPTPIPEETLEKGSEVKLEKPVSPKREEKEELCPFPSQIPDSCAEDSLAPPGTAEDSLMPPGTGQVYVPSCASVEEEHKSFTDSDSDDDGVQVHL